MLYQILKPVVTLAVHIFYKKIEIVNGERLNEEGPTLIVSNHNNAFLDAVVVEMFVKQQIYSIARGDVFGNRFIRAILTQLRILPIFRKEEGPGQMHKNEATFERCTELLAAGESIIMYPEGDCVTEKRLRKLRKGAARIALRTEAKNDFKLNVKVLPVGLNYSAAKNFRSKLFINIGKPISIADYQKQFEQDSVKAINNLTQHVEREMRTLLVEQQHRVNDEVYENVLEMYKPQLMYSLNLNPRNLQDDHEANRAIASAINFYHAHHHEELVRFKQLMHEYQMQLSSLQLRDSFLSRESIQGITVFSAVQEGVLLGAGLPLHAAGLLFNYLPYRFAYRTADKKVKQVHFHASVNFVIGMFSWIAYYLVQLLAVALISKSILLTLIFALLIPATGVYSIYFYSFMKKAGYRSRLITLMYKEKTGMEHLLQKRNQLLQQIEKAKAVYCKSVKG